MRSTRSGMASNWLVLLLSLFFLGGSAVLFLAVTRGDEKRMSVTTARVAYSPKDFPEIQWNEPLLPALQEQQTEPGTFAVPPPPFSEGVFPCSDCHADMEPNVQRRELEYHEDIALRHGAESRWCFDCHDASDRDKLRLADGSTLDFDESYLLCGQCHGTIFRDWRAGIHGRRRGYWNGPKSYLLCAHCHDPHAPKFPKLEALPPPVRPQFLVEPQLKTPSPPPQEGQSHD
jgi:hypothetical protein